MQIFLLFLIIFVASIYFIKKSNKKIEKLKIYEFENRSGGGIVGFKSYEDAQNHNAEFKLHTGIISLLMKIVVFSGLIVLLFICYFIFR